MCNIVQYIRRFLFFLILTLSSVLSYAQQDTEFWFAAPYINCEHGSSSPYRLVVFAFDRAATVTISMPANPDFKPIVREITANSYANIVLAQDKSEGDAIITTPFNEITNRGLLIESTSRVECYYQIDGDNSEAFTLKGRNALGTDFLVTGQKSYNNGSTGDWYGARNSIHIVATEDNTLVRIVPSCAILDMVGTVGDTIDVVLQKGETYAVASADNIAMSNLIGSRILSNAPIAVTMNDDSVTPNDSNADDIGEQLLSTEFAGTNFVVVAEGGEYELCTVFALEDNTQIIISGGETYEIGKGEYQTISLSGTEAMFIQTSQPVMLFQVIAAGNGGELGGTIVPHFECTGSMQAGYMPFSGYYDVYINLVTHKTNISSFTINGEPIESSEFSAVDSSDEYYYARIWKLSSDSPYVVRCSSGIFQMGVSEGSSSGSNTYGFFSDYEQHIPIIVEANGILIDTMCNVVSGQNLSLIARPATGFEIENITWTLPDGTSRQGDMVDLGIVTPELCGEYTVTAITDQCGEISHRFKVLLQAADVIVADVFCQGDVYIWEGHYMADGTPLTFTQAGDYTDVLVDSYGNDSVCVLHLEEVVPPVLTIRPDTTINAGDEVLLWATGADYIQWSPDTYITQNDEMQSIAMPQTTIQYTATGYNIPKEGNNIVINGDFEDGNTGFFTDFHYFTPYTSPGSCGDYTITDDVMGYWYGYVGSVKAYGGQGNMMILDGMTTPHAVVWSQQVTVKPNTLYAFSAQVMSALDSYMEGQYALLQFAVNDEQVGPIFHSPNRLYEWEKFYSLWYSGDATTVVLTIYNQNDNYLGNDFAIDEIRFEELSTECPATASVTISVIGDEPCAEGVVTEMFDTICYGESYEWQGVVYTESTEEILVLTDVKGCDSTVILHLEVLPTTYNVVDTAIVRGDTYMWKGVEYAESVVLADTLVNVYGCDSIEILDLKVVENSVTLHRLEVVDMCADDSLMQVLIDWDGYVDSVGLYFLRDTLDSIQTGLHDTVVPMPADGNLSIPYIYVRAGVHELTVVGYFRQEMMFAENTTLTVLYPSSVMEQRWDDVICVLTSAYNGGYDFTSFQWYKNGSPLAGETGYYLSQALETGAEYSALLTDINGVQLMTCPIIVGYEQPAISVEPTLVAKRQPVRCQVPDAAYVWVYDAMGKLQISSSLQQGENSLHMPQQSGMYMLKVQLLSGEQRAFKVLVQ